MTTAQLRPKANSSYTFHPFELAFCGYSGSGKTTLISRLVASLANEYRIGYFKHDAHTFSMDKKGKDTYAISKAGAETIFISNAEHFAYLGNGQLDVAFKKQLFLNEDFIIVEGFKNSPLPKIVVIDTEKKILGKVRSGEIENILCYVGQDHHRPEDLNVAPYFHRDDVEAIRAFILDWLRFRSTLSPIYGLVLCGGRSIRMKRDKALLQYHERPQIVHCVELLKDHCHSVFVSARANQWPGIQQLEVPIIEDQVLNLGPLSGILSAMLSHPNAAWLVIACDLPFLKHATLSQLVSERDPLKHATAYLSSHDGLPEPLCAIWEPKSFSICWNALGHGKKCPRKILMNNPSKLIALDPAQSMALDNINNSEEFAMAQSKLQEGILNKYD